ncbi:MAG: acyltransferase [Candidatus Omnitrophica bacterium]|nr:acyltransferase [Candidatus Omnitrophota bacterium]
MNILKIFFNTYKFDALLYFCNYIIAGFPSAHVRHFFYKRVMLVEMEESAHIMSGMWLDSRANLKIGENSIVNQRCRLDNRGGIEIGRNVSISNETHILSADHDIQDKSFKGRKRKVIIRDRVFIGSRATILPGVTIGEGAVVCSCACVTKDIPAYAIVGGVPAKIIGMRNKELTYKTIYKRHFF